jgi:excisionase family DNA binding protein
MLWFMGFITTTQAAERLGISPQRVFQLIQDGRMPAQKVGHIYVIDAAMLKTVKRKKPGRPRTKKPPAKKRKRVMMS